MCILVICTFRSKPGLWKFANPGCGMIRARMCLSHLSTRGTEELFCAMLRDSTAISMFLHVPSRKTPGLLFSLPTSPSAAPRPSSALCPTEKAWAPLGHFGQPRDASWKWRWHDQVSPALFPLAHHTAQPLPKWQPRLCHDQKSARHSLHYQK